VGPLLVDALSLVGDYRKKKRGAAAKLKDPAPRYLGGVVRASCKTRGANEKFTTHKSL